MISFFVLALALIWLFDGSLKEKYEDIKSNPVLLSIGVFIGYMCLSLLWSSDLQEGFNTARLYGYWILIFVLATRLKKDALQPIISAFLLGMMVSEIIAYGVFFDFWTFKTMSKEYLSPFMMHIDYSVFLAFASILLLNRLLSSSYSFKEKIFFFVFFCTVTGNLFLAPGRTGQVAFILGMIAVFLYHYKLNIKVIFSLVGGLVLILFVAYSVSDMFKQRVQDGQTDLHMLKNGNYDGSWGTRVAFILTSIEIVKENPLLGTGLGGSIPAAERIFDKEDLGFSEFVQSFIISNHFHNQYLMIVVEGGLIGMVLLLNIFWQILKRFQILEDDVKEIVFPFMIVFLFSCVAEPLWMKQFTIGLWLLVVGVFISRNSNEEKNNLKLKVD